VLVGQTPSFRGRARERAALDGLLDGVREGESAVLVMRGEAGIGKTALMQYCARQASGCRVAQIAGVESELEMPFAAVQQLCGPMLGHLDALPEPQQHALRVAFGLEVGNAPDIFVVGLAVLGVFAEVASERPLVCLVDDAQWLDDASRQVLGFVGRRLVAEAVLLLLAVREAGDEQLFPALTSLTVEGLTEEDARALLTATIAVQLDEQVRDRIVAETHGNPLRLLELPREMSPGELAGGFGAAHASPTSGPMEEHYTRRIRALSEPTQQLLLLAAADPSADATLLWRAAEMLGIPRSAAVAAESEQLVEIGSQVRFRHPLVRSAAYASGAPDDRCAAHAALAEAIDAEVDPERRVWHLAAAATGPDDVIASQLEHAAVAAQARAGLAGAAALLQRSVELTSDSERRADRALAAAQAHLHAGSLDAAMALMAEARALAIDDVQRGRVERLMGEAQYRSKPGPEVPVVLVEVAKTLEPLDAQLARAAYLEAWMASYAAGPYARPGGLLAEVASAMQSAPPPPNEPPSWDLFLDGLAASVTDGRAASVAGLRRAVDAFVSGEISDGDFMQWGHFATHSAVTLWDWRCWESLSAKHVELARASGALAPLSIALNGRGINYTWYGDLEAATAVVAEHDAVNEATGIGWFPAGGLFLAAYRGRPDDLALMSANAAKFAEYGMGQGSQFAIWTTAILCNGLGRYADAVAAAEHAAYEMEIPNGTGWALVELVEAAVRNRQPDVARDAMEQLPKHTLEDSDWAMGLEARCRALVTEGSEAEQWYRDAVERLGRTPFRTELARAHLLYGEWLRREGRRVDARQQLARAFELFSAMGAEAFAERARRELMATGEKVRKRNVTTHNELTPQEEHIARLARDGRSNAEIGAELFLSVRTVEWHLRKVFQKLGISSRKDLKDAMPARRQSSSPSDRVQTEETRKVRDSQLSGS
jgi:DNA-binding CsgD family transcriptional regulator/tetratricopeptide (TPR) repeat protein